MAVRIMDETMTQDAYREESAMSENAITRRSFLAGSAGVAAVAAGAGFLSFNAWEQADARGTSDIDHHTAHSLCNSCSSKCGFTGYVVDGKLGKMIGDANHPNCEGTLCGRGYGFASIAYNEDRLTDPRRSRRSSTRRAPRRSPWCRTRARAARITPSVS